MHSELPEFSGMWSFCSRRGGKGCLHFLVMLFGSSLSFFFFMSSAKHLKPNIPNGLTEPRVLDVPTVAGEPGFFKESERDK